MCRFCNVFKREERAPTSDASKPRKRTTKTKYYNTFRTTCYKQHLELEHPAKWADYDRLRTEEEKEAFFGSPLAVPVSSLLHAHFDISTSALVVRINSIVDVIIGDLLFHPEDHEGVTHQRAMRLFERSLSSEGEVIGYTTTIKNQKRFILLVGLIARGTSFRMAADILQLVRDETGLSVYGGSTSTLVSNCARVYVLLLFKV